MLIYIICIYLPHLWLVFGLEYKENSITVGKNDINISYIAYDESKNLGQFIYMLFSYKKDINNIDYSAAKKFLVWSHSGEIKIVKLNNEILCAPNSLQKSNEISMTKTIHKYGVYYKTFTVDWIHNLVYFISPEEKQILAANLSVPHNKAIIVQNIKEIVGNIKVDPISQFLFWTQWDATLNSVELMRSNLDGSQQITLLQTSGAMVYKFSIDSSKREIYLFNTTLCIMDFNGERIRRFDNIIKQTNSVDVELDYCSNKLFIAHMKNSSVTVVNTSNHEFSISELFLTSKSIDSFKVIHTSCQTVAKNEILLPDQCLNNNCSHICVPVNNTFYSCLCSPHERIRSNKYCISGIHKNPLITDTPITTTASTPTKISTTISPVIKISNEILSNFTTNAVIDGTTPTATPSAHTTFSPIKSEEASNLITLNPLTPTKPTEIPSLKYAKFTIMSVMLMIAIIGIIFVMNYYQTKFRNKLNDNRNKRLNKTPVIKFRRASETQRSDEQYIEIDETIRFIKDSEDSLVLDSRNLRFDESNVIGSGNFGIVFRGTLTYPYIGCAENVAIKTLNRVNVDQELKRNFLDECLRMRDFNHPNVLRLIGFCLKGNKPLIVMPYMENGDTLTYIRNKNSITNETLLGFAIQVANGMLYLSHQKIVHIDLAARNCMLDENLNVKIADFGLSRDIYLTGNYKTYTSVQFPYKWVAIECLEGLMDKNKAKIFDNQTDVWSFGVLVWELMTRGDEPYGDISLPELLCLLIREERLPQPVDCPEHVFVLMRKCWDKDPIFRPLFDELSNELETYKYFIELEKQNKISKMNKPLRNALRIPLQY